MQCADMNRPSLTIKIKNEQVSTITGNNVFRLRNYRPEPTKTKNTDKQSLTKSDKYQGEEMVTYGTSTDKTFPNTVKATPTYTIDAADVKTKVNATTVEDTIRYAPGY